MSFTELIKQGDKYYTVIAVIVAIFMIAIVYLIWLDRKMSKLEKKNEE
jgi:hypothetical protein